MSKIARSQALDAGAWNLLGSTMTPPDIRARLHSICALYANARDPASRLALLERLEQMTLETAQTLALDLLENGWRPEPAEEQI
jgi:hypothetical protein